MGAMSRSPARTAALSRFLNDGPLCRAAIPRGTLLPGRSAFPLTVQLLLWLSLAWGGGCPQAPLGIDALVPTVMGPGTHRSWGGVLIRLVGSAGGSGGQLRGGGQESSRPLGVHPPSQPSYPQGEAYFS